MRDDNWFCLEFCRLFCVNKAMTDGIPMSFLLCPAKFCAMCHPCLSSAFHVLSDVTNVLHVRFEDQDSAVYPGQEELGGGQPLPGAGDPEAERLPALSQHRVPGRLGHGGVVAGRWNFSIFYGS